MDRPTHGPRLFADRCKTAGVPTDIYFAGESVRVRVAEDPDQVAEAFTSAGGLPFRLTGQSHDGAVYVNPAMVAFWSASDVDRASEVEEPPQPVSTRGAITDIWGQPLRRKPRH